jgi:hypothetical protein
MNILKNKSAAPVGNAIIWASVMLASAMVTKGSEGSGDLVMIMVAGWFASSLLFYKKK